MSDNNVTEAEHEGNPPLPFYDERPFHDCLRDCFYLDEGLNFTHAFVALTWALIRNEGAARDDEVLTKFRDQVVGILDGRDTDRERFRLLAAFHALAVELVGITCSAVEASPGDEKSA